MRADNRIVRSPSRVPAPRSPVADAGLMRPDWTRGQPRASNRLWLDKNENSDPELAVVVAHVLAQIPSEVLYAYPESAPLYAKLASHIGTKSENLMLAAGSDGVIRSVYEAFVREGDAVVRTRPTFAMYEVYSRMYGAQDIAVDYHLSNDRPILDTEAMIETIRTVRPRVVCLPNPDSPTGTVLSPDELRAVIETASEAGAVMLVDEAYFPFYEHTVAPWIDEFPHLVVARSTGKAWGMAGFRIGYAVAASEMACILHKVRPMYEASTIAIAVFERMLDKTDAMYASVARLNKGKRVFLDAMRDLGFRTHAGHGNFCHVAFDGWAERVHTALADLVYYRKDFAEPCLQGFSRFTATTAERFEPIIARITEVIRQKSL